MDDCVGWMIRTVGGWLCWMDDKDSWWMVVLDG